MDFQTNPGQIKNHSNCMTRANGGWESKHSYVVRKNHTQRPCGKQARLVKAECKIMDNTLCTDSQTTCNSGTASHM